METELVKTEQVMEKLEQDVDIEILLIYVPQYNKMMFYVDQAYIARWRYNAKRAPQAQMRIKILEKL